MNESEVIVEIGVEFGSIALYGVRTERAWSFTLEVIDQTPELIDEEWIQHKSAAVDSWEAALKLLDQYPWFRLHPIRIHPEFRRKIWVAVLGRLQTDPEISPHALGRWRELCMMTTFNSFLEEYQSAWRRKNVSNQRHGTFKGEPYPWILSSSDDWKEGLWCEIRISLSRYICENQIRKHKYSHHLNSSWILCANLYFPFREARGLPLLAGFLRTKVSSDIRDVEKVELEYVEDPPLDPKSLFGESDTGMRGANQTSPDVAFLVKTKDCRGLILTESKLAEHHFYECSGHKRDSCNPDATRCLDWAKLSADKHGRCWQMQWANGARKNRTYWCHIHLSEHGQRTFTRCPAASDGYQLFRQQALAEAIATSKKYNLVVSCVAYDERNTELLHCLRTTGIDNFAEGWGTLFNGRAKFATWTHQEWVSWVRDNDHHRDWCDWLSYVEGRYGYGSG
jgi:hypothetical protein